MDAARNRALLLTLAGIALLLGATLLAYRAPAALGPEAPLTTFSAYRARALLQDLLGDGAPHPIGSAAAAQVRDRIVRQLAALGYRTELQSGLVCNDNGTCGNPINVVASLADGVGKDAVLLAAHYDSVAAGPGASDNGVGVATVLEIARILAALPAPPHPIVLLLSDGEEAGLLGAKLFVQRHPWARQVKAAINLDARGTSGPSLMFETGSANAWAMRLYGAAVARPITSSIYQFGYQQLPNDTDFTLFKAAGYQGFNFAFIGDVGRYHTPLDNWANTTPSSIQHQGDNALASLLALANAANLQPPTAESVFFDGYARTLLVWPAKLSLPAALLLLLLLSLETTVLLRKRMLAGRQLLWGGLGVLASLSLGPLLNLGLLALLSLSGKMPPIASQSWIAEPLPMSIACVAIAFVASGTVSILWGRRAGFWGFWLAATLLYMLLAGVSAALIPGISFVFLLTALAASLAVIPCLLSRSQAGTAGWMTDMAAIIPALLIFAAVLPMLRFAYTALGSLAWSVATPVFCLASISLLPLLAAASHRSRQRLSSLAAVTVVAGALITLYLPTYSVRWPERINIEYWLEAGGRAHWLALPDAKRLPAAMTRAVDFDPVPRPRFAGSSVRAFFAAAPALALAAPQLTQISSMPLARSTQYHLRLRSARGAPQAMLIFPASAQVQDIVIATAAGPLRARLGRLTNGATLLNMVGLPAAGVEFSIEAVGHSALAVQVFDQSYELPEQQLWQRVRPPNTTSSQDGDSTVVQRMVRLDPG